MCEGKDVAKRDEKKNSLLNVWNNEYKVFFFFYFFIYKKEPKICIFSTKEMRVIRGKFFAVKFSTVLQYKC